MEVWVTYYDFGKKKTVRELRTIDDSDSVDLLKSKKIENNNEGSISEKSEKHNLVELVKENKKQLIVVGVGIAVSIAAIMGYKNRNALSHIRMIFETKGKKKLPCSASVKPTIEPSSVMTLSLDTQQRKLPQEISYHLRNLPEGWNASAGKVATAAENGYKFREGQTWVKNYSKNKIVA